MKIHAILLPLILVICTSCEDRDELVVTETREITTKDIPTKLNASSDERFRDVKPSPVQGTPPENWLKQPSTQFRLLNYRFGESGLGEVWVSLSSGGVLENANRWLKQFQQEAITADELAAIEIVQTAGSEGRLIQAEGSYAGMGAEPRDDFALAGVIAPIDGRILTVKMIGPKAEVAAAEEDLKRFSESLVLKDQF